ncbi:MAG: threonylcarbamoyl-AMP synthase [Clostridiales bacterium]|nr:threonylcarbamoyl-AMP synthase [Clostridiales bacterium]
MKTELLQFNDADLITAGKYIRDGKLVAFPTETVYGLGANAYDSEAVRSTYTAKGRPSDNPLIVHIWHKEQIYGVAREVNDDAVKIVNSLMPASLTVVLPKKDVISDAITAGLDTVAIRMPKSVQAREFLRYAEVPVTAPSANLSGRPSPTNWQRVYDDLNGKISAILCGDPCQVGIESTVLDLSGKDPLILRPGVVTADMIEAVLHKSVRVVTNPKEKVNSPGVRYKHYAPKVDMVLDVSGDMEKLSRYYDGLIASGRNPVLLVEKPQLFGSRNAVCIGQTDDEVARNLFENLRILEGKFDYIIASYTSTTPFAKSVLNRLVRSAGNNLI